MAYHFEQSAADRVWFNFLVREALNTRDDLLAYEAERRPVIQAQVDEIRRRQQRGLI